MDQQGSASGQPYSGGATERGKSGDGTGETYAKLKRNRAWCHAEVRASSLLDSPIGGSHLVRRSFGEKPVDKYGPGSEGDLVEVVCWLSQHLHTGGSSFGELFSSTTAGRGAACQNSGADRGSTSVVTLFQVFQAYLHTKGLSSSSIYGFCHEKNTVEPVEERAAGAGAGD